MTTPPTATQPAPRHAALVRGDDGNLHMRRFDSGAAAAMAAGAREIVPPTTEIEMVMGRKGHFLSPRQFAEKLGISSRTVRRAFNEGGLPGAKEHGPKTLRIPSATLRLAEAYGLQRVVRWAKAGVI